MWILYRQKKDKMKSFYLLDTFDDVLAYLRREMRYKYHCNDIISQLVDIEEMVGKMAYKITNDGKMSFKLNDIENEIFNLDLFPRKY